MHWSGKIFFRRACFFALSCAAASGPSWGAESVKPAEPVKAEPVKAESVKESAEESTAKKWKFEGEVVADLRYDQKPSGVNGNTQFEIPFLGLRLQKDFTEKSSFWVELDGATPTQGTVATSGSATGGSAAGGSAAGEGATNGNATEIFLNEVTYRTAISPTGDLQLGLLISDVFTRQENYSPLRRLFAEMDYPFVTQSYLPESDYGFRIQGTIFESWSTGFSVTNGQGRGQVGQGTFKDIGTWFIGEWKTAAERQWMFMITYLQGGYQNIDLIQAVKQRASMSLWTQGKRGVGGVGAHVEYLVADDPADAISGKVAQGVDLTDLLGQRVHAQGFSGHLNYDWTGPEGEWSAFIRSDRWEPVRGDGGRAISSSSFGLALQPQSGPQWILSNAATSFGPHHSVLARDQQSWRLSVYLKLD
ncbi:MAG: hypothetical protein C5B49_09045 [Bdellovibrio sp.]|nr:MAG: hypothetical protein C5B49_09045 [Bdellovibrio sp.]